MNKLSFSLIFTLGLLLLVPAEGQAQRKRNKKQAAAETAVQVSYPTQAFEAIEWRNLGPFRGGRSAAVIGVPGKPNLFYMGATGGGVWRTQDGGQSWENISDGYFGGSIGAVAVSDWDNNVIYVGGGEVTVRGNVSYGYGMWKSVDAGKSWTHIGLDKSRHIPRIRIHPKNPDLVYAAVMGDLYKSSEERGVYRSKDGGKSWERVLFANADAGAVDLCMDPTNPRILYASTWNVRRTPYSLSSGGPGSALWKSTDGGDTWVNLMDKKGMPEGTIGIIGVTVSAANPNRVWALIENQEGGIFRSEDGGESWRRINQERKLRQRAWYYTRIYADPQDEDVVYVMNVRFHKSKDGGKTFEMYRTPHGDHHDLWIAPEDPQRLIVGDDGGAQISFDGGENWSTYYNQPTAQYYRVTTDDHFPFRIYVAQQDNSTQRVLSRTDGRSIGRQDWESSAGGESAHMAPDPDDNDIVYGGSYGGFLTRLNHRTGERRAINVWPDNPLGHGAEGMKYRFQWNFPIFFSPHNSDKLYACSQNLHVSYDEGQSWEIISPDLTRNDPEKLVSSGGPITKDNTGVEYYCTIFAAAESQQEEGVIWTGSDDGLIHITRDGGDNWTNVTPPASIMPEWIQINSIELDPHEPGGLYVAATMYKWGDYQPYLYKTKDYGQSWQKIVDGIEKEHFTRVVRADPDRKGLLYAGTESGMYVSFDDGASWQSFQLNLPTVPITDLAVKQKSLVAATQGRSIWMIDDLSPLHQMDADIAKADFYLFRPLDSYRMPGGQSARPSRTEGQNHPGGVMVYFYLNEEPDSLEEISLTFMEEDGDEIKTFSTQSKDKKLKLKDLKKGSNRFIWDMRYADATTVEGMILWFAQTQGPKAVPATYQVQLNVAGESMTQAFKILPDPRSSSSLEDMQAQFDFLVANRDKLSETHEAIVQIRKARQQVKAVSEKVKEQEEMESLVKLAERIDSTVTEVEKALYQTKNRSAQDPLNFPIRLNNKLGHVGALTAIGDFRPTEQAIAVQKELSEAIDRQLQIWRAVKSRDLPAFNRLVRELNVNAVQLEETPMEN
jgi:photosystem II stability/assembly factor-like uncharacterized protein